MDRLRSGLVCAVMLASPGCGWLLGADFDRDLAPGASPMETGTGSSPQPDAEDARRASDAPASDANEQVDAAQPPAARCGSTQGLDPASPWPIEGYCPTRVGHAPVPTARAPFIRWRYSVGSTTFGPNEFMSAPVIAGDGTVYVLAAEVTDSGAFRYLLMGARQGVATLRATLPSGAGSPSGGSPTLAANGAIYVATLGVLSAWSRAGEMLWRYDLGAAGGSSPVVLPDGTIVVVENRSITALTPTGSVRWTYPSSGGRFLFSPAVTPSGLLVVAEGSPAGQFAGAVVVLTPEGDLRRRVPTSYAPETSPVVDAEERIWLRDLASFYVIDATGAVAYKAGFRLNDPQLFPAVVGMHAWFTARRDRAVLVDVAPGGFEPLESWGSNTSGAAVTADGTVVVGSRERQTQALSWRKRSGEIVSTVPLEPDGRDVWGIALGADGAAYLPWGATLYAIGD